MKKALILLLLSAFLFACKKNPKDVKPAVTVGEISGKVAVPAPVALIYAADINGNKTSGAIDPGTGAFIIDSLPEGKYQLSISPEPRYFLAGALAVDVQRGKTSAAGPLKVDTCLMKFKVNTDVFWRQFASCYFENGRLVIQCKWSNFVYNGPAGVPGANNKLLYFSANGVNSPGTYQLGGTNSTMTYSETIVKSGSVTSDKKWEISNSAPEGSLEITAIDPVAKAIRGKFSATLNGVSPTLAARTIADGEFYLHYE